MSNVIGLGIYTVPEASRLTGVAAPRIRRWLGGYKYVHRGIERRSPPVRSSALPRIDNRLLLSFADLIETRFIDAFIRQGISLAKIRRASRSAARILATPHPFSTMKFKTDGRTVFLYQVSEKTGDEWLVDLFTNQHEFKSVTWPSLYSGLEYSDLDQLQRWWPRYPKRQIVLDPERAFGQPVLHRWGIRTAILADAYDVEQSAERVARWYEIPEDAVIQAVEYEEALAA